MTTIAANLQSMAADSMISSDREDISVEKLHRFDNGAILGCTGRVSDIDQVVSWMAGGRKGQRPKVNDFEALLLTHKGLFYIGPRLVPRGVTEGCAAVGSGTQAAMAALRSGWSPRKAVQHACLADKNSAPPVRVMRLRKG